MEERCSCQETSTASGSSQDKKMDWYYVEVFAPVAKNRSYRLFLAFASFMGFIVYQMDVKSAFLYGTIDEEVYVSQPPGFVDPEHPTRNKKDIMLVQVYVDDIIFGSTNKSWCADFEADAKRFLMAPMDALTPWRQVDRLTKDEELLDVDVHCQFYDRLKFYHVTPKTSHLNAVKRIFKYLKGKPNLGLWYPRDSPLDLEAFSVLSDLVVQS
ncbi:retrovirus-related pol polyprotein from transposon TNT 1-94 [Tanacetum coccineum]|uniref:Retrovirus-related pol polyprotein from transposon TNT 1-94 n=1 Tax=Tanacetum coccineum TaxID=301880 RepID=A0ABQ5GW57_9ASTR